jgi:hypothetical protein
MKKTLALLCALLITAGFSHSQEYRQLLDGKMAGLLHEAISGELAKEYTIEIARWHRVQGSRQYRKSAQYVLAQLRDFGFSEEDAYIETSKSDGKVHYQTWQSPSGWDMEAAELRMVEPYEERIVGFPEIAMSLITYSNPGDVTAELVWVGAGTSDRDYQDRDVRGKMVLATGYGGEVHRHAVLKHGAKAVVCYLDDERAKEYPDMLAYTGMWPKTEEIPNVTFGFNLTNRQGEKLKSLLHSGEKVVLHGWAKGIGLEPYYMDAPVAVIRGSEHPEEELVFVAHLDHPKESANDNASGSAVLLEMARSIKELVDSGRMAAPKRTIRFLWICEFYGMMAYVDKHPELKGPAMGGHGLASINMDMVGEHLELIHTNMNFTSTPRSIPSVLNDVVQNMAEMVDRMNIRTPRGSLSRFNFRVTPYSGGSDHNIFIALKIPGMMFGHGDYTHHTSEDTSDKVDPVELERAGIIGAASMLYLANLNQDQAADLAHLAGARAAQIMGLASRRAHRYLADVTPSTYRKIWAEAQNLLDHELKWRQEALLDILHFSQDPLSKDAVDLALKQIESQHVILTRGLEAALVARGFSVDQKPVLDPEPDTRIPIRLTRGPLAGGLPESRLSPEAAAWYRSEGRALSRLRFELVNFIDGRNTVSAIRDAVSAEYRPVEKALVARFIEDLERAGLVRWK